LPITHCFNTFLRCLHAKVLHIWCVQKFQKLAEGLPWSKHVHSKLVCAITREIMNEHNPPMVLPNGAVYSEKAVQQVASRNHNIFTCPKTGARALSQHSACFQHLGSS
jgi:hypothetical protein